MKTPRRKRRTPKPGRTKARIPSPTTTAEMERQVIDAIKKSVGALEGYDGVILAIAFHAVSMSVDRTLQAAMPAQAYEELMATATGFAEIDFLEPVTVPMPIPKG